MTLLRTLRIRDLVIVEDLTVEFGPGLNLLTGETGAGKSILVDAIGLVAGARGERALVRAGASRAGVEALFEVEGDSPSAVWLGDRGLADPEEAQVLLRRDVAVEGGGGAWINGSPCTLGMLRELGERLLELHGQQDPKRLLEQERHLEILDAFGGHRAEREAVRVAFEGVREATAALGALREHETDRAERMERLEGVVAELSSLAPRAGELAELERERRVLRNAGRMAELLDAVVALSYEGDSAAASLSAAAAARAEELAELDPALAELAERLRAASIELEDAGQGFRDYRERTDFDPARLEALESRRAAVEHACLRHGSDEAGLVALRERAEEELRSLGTLGAAVRTAEEALGAAEKRYAAAASVLTRVRRRAAAALERAVCEQLAELALSKARFRVELPAARGAPLGRGAADCPLTPSGAERVEFLLAANPGEPLRPLRRTASGGELARVMLALHVAARDRANGRIVVFDEVDAGVSGAVADAVGSRLQRLSRSNQLLCVTHLPQVAAYADRHFRVRKRVRRGRTHAGIADLSGSERVEELARMLGGRGPTPTSRRHASELLQAAGRVRRGRVRSEA